MSKEIGAKEDLRFAWSTIGEQIHTGWVTEVDSNTLHVHCFDGVMRATEGTAEECAQYRAVLRARKAQQPEEGDPK